MSIIRISPLSAHLPDLHLVHVHPLIVDVGSGEILGMYHYRHLYT